ncbi:uncharacterized protein LOC116341019 isoform X3 [Contarinia nasturtii]|uniref:uncharacterized protein LOC116341019 isoform X3 n=1 Tax=Contarinia nasturtii TaxID=265458 RepID=UPI0012D3AD5D|nr:uncharacterized protein LOC116341019 isoform X3 [Contarinia nasturtii]
MYFVRNMPLALIVCIFLLSGFQAKEVHLETESTILIDAKKFLEIFKKSNETNVCGENEEYLECGKKCMLSCRYSASSFGIALSEDECEKNECVKGCFCKDGLVRQRDKCVPVAECSSRQSKAFDIEMDTSYNSEPPRRFQGIKPSCGPHGCSSSSVSCGAGGCGSTCGPKGCTTHGNGLSIHNYNQAVASGNVCNSGNCGGHYRPSRPYPPYPFYPTSGGYPWGGNYWGNGGGFNYWGGNGIYYPGGYYQGIYYPAGYYPTYPWLLYNTGINNGGTTTTTTTTSTITRRLNDALGNFIFQDTINGVVTNYSTNGFESLYPNGTRTYTYNDPSAFVIQNPDGTFSGDVNTILGLFSRLSSSFRSHEQSFGTPHNNQNDDDEISAAKPSNEYPSIQNLFNTNFSPFTTLVGAAITPVVIPGFSPASKPELFDKKKPSHNHGSSSKKLTEESEKKTNIMFYIPNLQYYSGVNPLNSLEKHSSFAPNQVPQKNQAAYFNYLNTYKPNVPNFNGELQYIVLNNDFVPEYAQPNAHFNGPFNIPNEHPYAHFNPSFNTPHNGYNPSLNSPFNGINPTPTFMNIQPLPLAKKTNSEVHTIKPVEIIDKSDESEIETPVKRQPRL